MKDFKARYLKHLVGIRDGFRGLRRCENQIEYARSRGDFYTNCAELILLFYVICHRREQLFIYLSINILYLITKFK